MVSNTSQAGLAPADGAVERSALQDLEAQTQQAMWRRERRERISSVVYPVTLFVLVIVGWEIAVRALNVPKFLLPAPSEVIVEFVRRAPLLLFHGRVTAQEVLFGYTLSILTAVPLAVAIFASPLVGRSVYPLLVSSQLIPKSAIAPLFAVWFGFGLTSKVMIAFLISFFPIVINTVVGLASIEKEKVWLAQSMGLSPLQIFLKVRLPQALPSIFGGLKIAITLAVIGAIVGEFVGADAGLGYLLLIANGNLDTPLLFAGLASLTIIGVVAFTIIGTLERLAIPWHSSQRGAGGNE